MEDSKPRNLILGVKICVEPDVQIKHAKFLRLHLKSQDKRTHQNQLLHLLFPSIGFWATTGHHGVGEIPGYVEMNPTRSPESLNPPGPRELVNKPMFCHPHVYRMNQKQIRINPIDTWDPVRRDSLATPYHNLVIIGL